MSPLTTSGSPCALLADGTSNGPRHHVENEEAVAAFLGGDIGFMTIHAVNARTLERLDPRLPDDHNLDDLLELDRRARSAAHQAMKELVT